MFSLVRKVVAAAAVSLFASTSAFAVCSGAAPIGCTNIGSPQLTDYLLAGQTATGITGRVTVGSIVNLVPVPATVPTASLLGGAAGSYVPLGLGANLAISGGSLLVQTGTSGATIPLLNGTNTWANPQTFPGGLTGTLTGAASLNLLLTGGTLTGAITAPTIAVTGGGTWVGSSLTLAPLYSVPGWSGTSSATGYTPLFGYLSPQDNVVATAGSGTAGIVIEHVIGAGHSGNATPIYGHITVAGAPIAAGYEYFGGAFRADCNANLGGTNVSPSGNCYGLNFGVHTTAAATYTNILAGYEDGISVLTGSSVKNKYGGYTMLSTGDAVQGSGNDAAWVAYNQFQNTTGSTGWKAGTQYGATDQYFPISPTGTIIKAVANAGGDNMIVGSILDFSALTTVTNYDIRMPNFTVTGAGLTASPVGFITGVGWTGSPPNASDKIANFDNLNGDTSVSVDNISVGASATSSVYLGNGSSSTQGTIYVNGSGNSTGNGAGALTIFGRSGVYLAYGGTNGLIIGPGGAITIPVSLTVGGASIKAPLSATSASIGGGALLAGACATTATTVTGATVGMVVLATPNTYPGAGNLWSSYVSGVNTVTTEICAVVAATPTASTYNLRVLQ